MLTISNDTALLRSLQIASDGAYSSLLERSKLPHLRAIRNLFRYMFIFFHINQLNMRCQRRDINEMELIRLYEIQIHS